MRRLIAALLMLALITAGSVSAARAQVPDPLLPSPGTAVLNPFGISWVPPPMTAGPPLPSSQPYFGTLLCPSDVVTEFALLFCGALSAGPAGAGSGPLVFNNSAGGGGSGGGGGGGCPVGSICVAAAANICWTGTDGGNIGGVATGGPTGGFISGCGNASFSFGALHHGDMIGAAVSTSLSTPGTFTLTADCGGTPPLGFDAQTASQAQGGTTVGCIAP